MALAIYSAVDAVRATLAAQFATEITSAGASITAPLGWTTVGHDMDRVRHTALPWGFVVQMPAQIVDEGSLYLVEWVIPVTIFIGIVASTGVEATDLANADDYLQIADRVIVKNGQPIAGTWIRPNRTAHAGIFEGSSKPLWGAKLDIELGTKVAYT